MRVAGTRLEDFYAFFYAKIMVFGDVNFREVLEDIGVLVYGMSF